MASPTKRPLGQLQGNDGRVTVVMDDGSTVTFDQMGNVVAQDDTPNPMRAAAMGAGNKQLAAQTIQQASAEDARRFDVGTGLSKQQIQNSANEIENTYRVNLMNARTNADVAAANAQYQQGQIQLSKDRLQFDRETQQQNFGLQQAGLSMRGLELQGTLRGSNNYFQAAQAARGFAALPGSAGFLDALQNNTHLAGFGAQGAAPDAVTLGSLTAKLAGGGPGTVPAALPSGTIVNGQVVSASSAPLSADDALLNQTHAIAQAGGGKIAPGQLESLRPNELGLLQSGIEAPDSQGHAYDWSNFLDQWRKSRIGNVTSGMGYKAA